MVAHALLTIGGSDSGGGAGVQADLRTFLNSFGHYGCSVITALTAQNPNGVLGVQGASSTIFSQQLEAVFSGFHILGAKSGMLWRRTLIEILADRLEKESIKYVLDPVMVSTSGRLLLAKSAINAMCKRLFPLADFITPNVMEAELLSGVKINSEDDIKKAMIQLRKFTQGVIIIKGGHLFDSDCATDWFLIDEHLYAGLLPRLEIDSIITHGTGCTFSAALLTSIFEQGSSIFSQISYAKGYVYKALQTTQMVNENLSQMWIPKPPFDKTYILDKGSI